MTIEKKSDTVHLLKFKDNSELLLIGTAHISKESVNEVNSYIEEYQPDRICIELDKTRYSNKKDTQTWSNKTISKVLKEGKGFLLLANMALASFQKRMGNSTGIKPGEEILKAAQLAEEKNIPFSFCDREIQTTFKRAWRKSNFWNKMKLLATLVSAAFSKEEVSEEELAELKKADVLETMLSEMSKELPTIKKVLIDERDLFLSSSMYNAKGKRKLGVIGAGHTSGILKNLEALDEGKISSDVTEISSVPNPSKIGKSLTYIIPALIIGIIVYGFAQSGWDKGLKLFSYWILVNAIFTGIGGLVALAHPLNIIISMLAAPFTSLNPTIGVGIVSGLLEFKFRKPSVKDFDSMGDDALSLKGWYKNRALHGLYVFFVCSIGSAIGTFIGFPVLLNILA
ncbi:MAG: TraB/GumN family protein [Sphaerochaetaceae bacterium]|nr:TraB/GumN family protein [Sphaerochaetaceae bacterium]MDC7249141.1 TraB/GumN family protein [Sphaerochaetaceae bacterium]